MSSRRRGGRRRPCRRTASRCPGALCWISFSLRSSRMGEPLDLPSAGRRRVVGPLRSAGADGDGAGTRCGGSAAARRAGQLNPLHARQEFLDAERFDVRLVGRDPGVLRAGANSRCSQTRLAAPARAWLLVLSPEGELWLWKSLLICAGVLTPGRASRSGRWSRPRRTSRSWNERIELPARG